VKSILLVKKFLGLVEMTSGQVNTSLSDMYIWKIGGERLHIFEKSSFFDLQPSAMIHTVSYFPTLLILKIWFSKGKSSTRIMTQSL